MAETPQNPSYSSSSLAATKSIYLRFVAEKRSLPHMWRRIDTSMKGDDETVFVSLMPIKTPPLANAVALVPIIYALGSCDSHYSYRHNQRSREVYYLDTRRPDFGWKKAPPLVRPRGELYLVARSGKIYAVGRNQGSYPYNTGSNKNEGIQREENWCEVLDPLSNSWKPMVGPDPETLIEFRELKHKETRCRAGGEGVLLDSGEGVFWYDVDCDSWSAMSRIPSKTKWEGAVVDDDMVFFFDRRVYGYDLRKGRFNYQKVRGLEMRWVSPYLIDHNAWGSPEPNYPTAFVVHVGDGRLCLLHETGLGLHCTRFRVSVYDDGDEEIEVFATIEAFRIYQVSEGYDLHECLVV